MNVKNASGEISGGNGEHLIGNKKTPVHICWLRLWVQVEQGWQPQSEMVLNDGGERKSQWADHWTVIVILCVWKKKCGSRL